MTEIIVRGGRFDCNGNVWRYPAPVDMDFLYLVARINGICEFTLKRALHSREHIKYEDFPFSGNKVVLRAFRHYPHSEIVEQPEVD